MSNDWFFEKFSLIADAPGAVERMRGLVLDWALSGKFSQKSEVPFKYVRLDSVADIRMGNSPPGHSYNETGQGVPLINGPVEFSSGPLGLTVRTKFTTSPTKLCKRGDLLICVRGSTTGRTNIAAFDACIGRGVAAITAHDNQIYINLFVWSQRAKIFALGTGSTFPSISYDDLASLELTLPPLAEQKRIAAKVEELMGICDALEAQQRERESRKSVLVRASLSRFAESPTPENLGYLFHKSYDIPPSELRKSILTLAVQGKLVSQDPNDEPAEELILRIASEKIRMVRSKEIKNEHPMDPIAPGEVFRIPTTWVWCRAGALSKPISSGSTPDQNIFHPSEGIPYLKVYNIRNQRVDFESKPQFITKSYHKEKMKRSTLVPGDVVMNIVGPPLGKVAIIPDSFPEWNCNQAISFFRPVFPELSEWIYTFLKEGSFLRNIQLIGTAGQDNISVTKCKFIPIAIPPILEQHRIVAKVDQLMALVDELERQQEASCEKASKLLDAIVQEMTSGGRDIAATLES
jgi:restriction endonuclease S subunit